MTVSSPYRRVTEPGLPTHSLPPAARPPPHTHTLSLSLFLTHIPPGRRLSLCWLSALWARNSSGSQLFWPSLDRLTRHSCFFCRFCRFGPSFFLLPVLLLTRLAIFFCFFLAILTGHLPIGSPWRLPKKEALSRCSKCQHDCLKISHASIVAVSRVLAM